MFSSLHHRSLMSHPSFSHEFLISVLHYLGPSCSFMSLCFLLISSLLHHGTIHHALLNFSSFFLVFLLLLAGILQQLWRPTCARDANGRSRCSWHDGQRKFIMLGCVWYVRFPSATILPHRWLPLERRGHFWMIFSVFNGDTGRSRRCSWHGDRHNKACGSLRELGGIQWLGHQIRSHFIR